MEQSQELHNFYLAYKKWLDDGAPEGKPFSRTFGLCYSIIQYSRKDHLGSILTDEITKQFIDARLQNKYPFGKMVYEQEHEYRTMHLNKKRIKWVNDHC